MTRPTGWRPTAFYWPNGGSQDHIAAAHLTGPEQPAQYIQDPIDSGGILLHRPWELASYDEKWGHARYQRPTSWDSGDGPEVFILKPPRQLTHPEQYGVTPDATVENVDLDEEPIIAPSGRILDEAAAEQLATETLERSRANLRPGGKLLSGDGSHSPVLQVRLSSASRAELTARADARHMSVLKDQREILKQSVAG